MIAAFDVHYRAEGDAFAAAVLFSDYVDEEPAAAYDLLLYISLPQEWIRKRRMKKSR